MYMGIRYFYPHGDEFEEMKSTVKEWKSLEKAKAYCERYTGGCRFAGASIEDEKGNIVYINSSYFINRASLRASF
mgnify:FL=1